MPVLTAEGVEVAAKHRKTDWKDIGGQLALPVGLWRLRLELGENDEGEEFRVHGEGRSKPVLPGEYGLTALVRVAPPYEVFLVAKHRRDLETHEPDPQDLQPRDPQDIEELAKLEHDSWSGWTRWQLKCMREEAQLVGLESELAATLGMECWRRWMRQMDTPYEELSEKEKESDRVEARKKLRAYRV